MRFYYKVKFMYEDYLHEIPPDGLDTFIHTIAKKIIIIKTFNVLFYFYFIQQKKNHNEMKAHNMTFLASKWSIWVD